MKYIFIFIFLFFSILSFGKNAKILTNRDAEKTNKVEISLDELVVQRKPNIVDVYANKELGKTTNSISQQLKPHAGIFLLLHAKKNN